jgi:hypothetical protein
MKIPLLLALFLIAFNIGAAQAPTPAPGEVTADDVRNLPVNGGAVKLVPQTAYTRPTATKRFNRYVKSIFGPVALGKNVLSAGYSTWRNSPEEWGDNWEGFGRRFASGLGKNAIKQTISYSLDEAFKLDSGSYRSNKKSVGGRLGDALMSPFTARKTDGKKVFGFPKVVGTYTASIIAAETWFPKRYTYKDGLKNGTISLGMNAAFSVFKEFFWKK